VEFRCHLQVFKEAPLEDQLELRSHRAVVTGHFTVGRWDIWERNGHSTNGKIIHKSTINSYKWKFQMRKPSINGGFSFAMFGSRTVSLNPFSEWKNHLQIAIKGG